MKKQDFRVLTIAASCAALVSLTAAVFYFVVTIHANPPVRTLSVEAIAPHKKSFSPAMLKKRLPPAGIKAVQTHLMRFQTRHRPSIVYGLSRSTRYVAMYKKLFKRHKMPEALAYLPLIESGFMEHAVSSAKAVGVWQFIPTTGAIYDLPQNQWADHRRDPVKSAEAAARYLKHLYSRFHSWELALAAYNAGSGTVERAIRANKAAGLPVHFWALKLPRETTRYVPAFISAVLIAKNPHAFDYNNIRFQAPLKFEQIKVSPGMPLAQLASKIGLPADAILDLNPHWIRGRVPPGGEVPHLMRIPQGSRAELLQKYIARLTSPPSDWLLHYVHPQDTIENLAERFDTHSTAIRQLNRLDQQSRIEPNQVLFIPL